MKLLQLQKLLKSIAIVAGGQVVQTIRRQFHLRLNFSDWTDSRDCSLSKVDFSNLWSSNVNGLELPKLSVSCVGVKQEQQAAALVKLLDFKNPLTIYENMYKISQFYKRLSSHEYKILKFLKVLGQHFLNNSLEPSKN